MHSKEILLQAHKQSYANKNRIRSAKVCGCFCCMKMFAPDLVVDWSLDTPDETAICPYCGIDSVIGDNEGFPLTETFLKTMYEEWFL